MAKFYDQLTDELTEFIRNQKVFFTATAPHSGRISLSPKGMDTFRCLNTKNVGYLDLTGSGNETSAHILENGRMTIMFCSFTEKPLILRLYGTGRVILPSSPEWSAYRPLFPDIPGVRQIILLQIESLQTSCGYGVPVADSLTHRPTLQQWAERKGRVGIEEYQQKNNTRSIDGLPTHLTGP
jgi:hypothetical protein